MTSTQELGPIEQRELEREVHFSLQSHELIDPNTNRGIVTGIERVEPISLAGNGLPCLVYEISVRDPFVEADPIANGIITEHVALLERTMHGRNFNPLEKRSEAQTEAERNAHTRAWLHQPELRSLSYWRSLVPSALALDYLTDPRVGREVTDKTGEHTAIATPETVAHWRHVKDAVAIRTREAAEAALVEKFLREEVIPNNGVHTINLESWASGTAGPVIRTAKLLHDELGVDIGLTVADWDGKALKHVRNHAVANDFDGGVTTLRANILDDSALQAVFAEHGLVSRRPLILENMGFEEYLPQVGDAIGAKKGQGLPQACEFTRRAFERIAPGGIVLSGNMVRPRPQLDFVFGSVDWPLINARSEEEILNVYKAAGILSNPLAEVSIYRVREEITGAHIYDIVAARKQREKRLHMPPQALGLSA